MRFRRSTPEEMKSISEFYWSHFPKQEITTTYIIQRTEDNKEWNVWGVEYDNLESAKKYKKMLMKNRRDFKLKRFPRYRIIKRTIIDEITKGIK